MNVSTVAVDNDAPTLSAYVPTALTAASNEPADATAIPMNLAYAIRSVSEDVSVAGAEFDADSYSATFDAASVMIR